MLSTTVLPDLTFPRLCLLRWYRLIKEAADSYQGRDGKSHKRTESAHTLLQAQDSSEAPAPSAAAEEEPPEGAGAPAGAEAALSPAAGAALPAEAFPAQSPTAPRSQLTARAAAGERDGQGMGWWGVGCYTRRGGGRGTEGWSHGALSGGGV